LTNEKTAWRTDWTPPEYWSWVTLNLLQSSGYWSPGSWSPVEWIFTPSIDKSDQGQIVVAEQGIEWCGVFLLLPPTSAVTSSRVVLRFSVKRFCINTRESYVVVTSPSHLHLFHFPYMSRVKAALFFPSKLRRVGFARCTCSVRA